jgi:DNA-directed RNA polymerase specialized sigma24 family protein
MLCNECLRRNECTELCEEVKEYADQDEVPQTELNIPNPFYGKWPTILKTDEARERLRKSYARLSPGEIAVGTLLSVGYSRQEIRQRLKITDNALRKRIYRLRKKIHK